MRGCSARSNPFYAGATRLVRRTSARHLLARRYRRGAAGSPPPEMLRVARGGRARVADRDREGVGGVIGLTAARGARAGSRPSAAPVPCPPSRSRRRPSSPPAACSRSRGRACLAAASMATPRACPTASAERDVLAEEEVLERHRLRLVPANQLDRAPRGACPAAARPARSRRSRSHPRRARPCAPRRCGRHRTRCSRYPDRCRSRSCPLDSRPHPRMSFRLEPAAAFSRISSGTSKLACTESTSSWSSSASIRRSSAGASLSPTSTVLFGSIESSADWTSTPASSSADADGGQIGRGGRDLEQVAVLGDVLGAGVDRRHQVVLAVAVAVDQDHAALLELPGDRARARRGCRRAARRRAGSPRRSGCGCRSAPRPGSPRRRARSPRR